MIQKPGNANTSTNKHKELMSN